jgi:hypothetical protein
MVKVGRKFRVRIRDMGIQVDTPVPMDRDMGMDRG